MAKGPNTGQTGRKSGGRYGSHDASGDSHQLDLLAVDGELLRDAVANACLAGDFISFSLTSDQGALCVRILSNDQQDVWYPASTEACEVVLQRVRDVAKG